MYDLVLSRAIMLYSHIQFLSAYLIRLIYLVISYFLARYVMVEYNVERKHLPNALKITPGKVNFRGFMGWYGHRVNGLDVNRSLPGCSNDILYNLYSCCFVLFYVSNSLPNTSEYMKDDILIIIISQLLKLCV